LISMVIRTKKSFQRKQESGQNYVFDIKFITSLLFP
jgi:hypothetical protein